jgi:hypothetical protein
LLLRGESDLLFGQQYNGKGKISKMADYVQLNICGLNAIEVVQKYFLYEIDKPIILLGDYDSKKRNAHEDNMLKADRIYEVKDAIKSLQAFGAEILAITFQPVTREGLRNLGFTISFDEYIAKLNEIYHVPVFVKNRYNKEFFLSTPEEVVNFSHKFKMTLDGVLLLKSCNNDVGCFMDTLEKINWDNVCEIHVKHMSFGENGLQGEKELNTLAVKATDVTSYAKRVKYLTFMVGRGGHPQFEPIAKQILDSLK